MASIKKRPNGSWRARFRDADGKEHARHFERKVDAQKWLDEVTASVVTGRYVDPAAGKMSFRVYFTEWADRQVWASGTQRAMTLAVNSMAFADSPLRAIRRSHVEAAIKALDARGLAPTTIRTRFNNVRAVFRAAVADRMIATDPTDNVALPRTRRAEAAMVLPTTEQVAALLAKADPSFRAFVAVAGFAGLRLGEAAALKVIDINFLRKHLQVRRQVQREVGGGVELRAPKYGSERTVYLPAELVQILSRHVADHCPGDDPDRWMFPGDNGNPAHQNTIGYRWRKTRTAAKVTGVRLHDMRHFYASGLIAAGCDVVTVQRALGHKSAAVTLSVYSHLWPTAEDRTRNAAAEMLRTALAAKLPADSRRTEKEA